VSYVHQANFAFSPEKKCQEIIYIAPHFLRLHYLFFFISESGKLRLAATGQPVNPADTVGCADERVPGGIPRTRRGKGAR
jgi:hypothetical protein